MSMTVGEDVVISETTCIRYPELVRLGNHVAIDSYFCCTVRLEVGDYVHIGPHVSVIGGKHGLLKMGHFTNLAAGCRVLCVSDRFAGEGLIGVAPAIPQEYRDKTLSGPVVIEDLANIGTNVVVFPGVTIRQGSVIGAGSVVRHSTEPWTIYVGSPAKAIKTRPHKVMLQYAREMGYLIELAHGAWGRPDRQRRESDP
jgi:galactoside O-acetyltransferase